MKLPSLVFQFCFVCQSIGVKINLVVVGNSVEYKKPNVVTSKLVLGPNVSQTSDEVFHSVDCKYKLSPPSTVDLLTADCGQAGKSAGHCLLLNKWPGDWPFKKNPIQEYGRDFL